MVRIYTPGISTYYGQGVARSLRASSWGWLMAPVSPTATEAAAVLISTAADLLASSSGSSAIKLGQLTARYKDVLDHEHCGALRYWQQQGWAN